MPAPPWSSWPSSAVIAALYLLKAILIPIALALLLACLLSPLTTFLRAAPAARADGRGGGPVPADGRARPLRRQPDGREPRAGGQHPARPTSSGSRARSAAGSPTWSATSPTSASILPEPGTIDQLGDANRDLLIDNLSYGLADLTIWVAQGLIVLILVLFLLAESEMLTPKVIRFFAPTPGDAAAAGADPRRA